MDSQGQAIALTDTMPTPIKHILVALDLDPKHQNPQVLAQAVQMAKLHNSTLMLCHGMSDPLPPASNVFASGSLGMYGSSYSPELFEQSQTLVRAEHDRLMDELTAIAAALEEQGVSTEVSVKEGEPSHYICKLAKDWSADLVVVGRRGRTGLTEIVMGSVSNYVVHHAPCAVLVVQ
jgi:nucleotide-binding universal stress UspA family protein